MQDVNDDDDDDDDEDDDTRDNAFAKKSKEDGLKYVFLYICLREPLILMIRFGF